MILQSLNDYYLRKQASEPDALAPEGFEFKELPFVVVLNSDGTVHDLRDTRSGEGRARRAKQYTVPKGIKRSSGVAANLLWDNAEYVLGQRCEGRESTKEDIDRRHWTFVARIDEELSECADEGLSALRTFLADVPLSRLSTFPAWSDVLAGNPNLSFQLVGDSGLIAERSAVVSFLKRRAVTTTSNGNQVRCLISGEVDELARLHDAIKGVWGANTSGANIVSFNLPAFNSYGKEQGANATIGKRAAASYAAALNALLARDSKQRVQVGDASTVFWASEADSPMESLFALLAGTAGDDPDAGTQAVKNLYAAIHNGAYLHDDADERFYVLGLSPNAARLSVRFWYAAPIKEFAIHIAAWFSDIELEFPVYEHRRFLPLGVLLKSLAAQGKAENIPPNLAGEVLRAIVSGLPLPAVLLQQAVIRCRAEQSVSPARACLIKAYLNRQARFNRRPEDQITMSLDPEDKRPAYRLGRLFAALERIQADALGGINASIRERYYGAASASPGSVFGLLIKNANNHLNKLKPGHEIAHKKLLGEILDGLADFPTQLSLPEQGLFAIGYYHQQQAFYARRPADEATTNEGN